MSSSAQADALLQWLRPRQADMLALLQTWVEIETPSLEPERVRGLARTVAGAFGAAGCRVEVGEDALECWADGADADARPVLVLGHLDTVYATGTLTTMPFGCDTDCASGPGVYDMKGGVVQALYALQALAACNRRPRRPVCYRWVYDEEIGSQRSRAGTGARARASECALVLEPGAEPGAQLKIGRKGIAMYTLSAHGVAAHAGVDFERGASAVAELARRVTEIAGWSDAAGGITVNAGVFHGGTRTNVVAAEAQADFDVRAWTRADLDRLDKQLRDLRPTDARVRLSVSGGVNRPPMEPTGASQELAARAQALGKGLGLELGTARTGGGSDGNFTAACGCPTLDGLGMAGDGAHTAQEHIRLDAWAPRTALVAALLAEA